MAYLLYGILKDPATIHNSGDAIRISAKSGHVPGVMGVKGNPVIFVKDLGLCAAVSELDVEKGAPSVAELLAYARVVEALHCRQVIVPMRYGCFLNGSQAIRDVMKAGQQQFERLLEELEGHVEMGIRILLPEKERKPRQGETMSGQGALSFLPNEKSAINGRAYLALRKVHYQRQEKTSQVRQALIDRHIQAFSGLYAKHRTETDEKRDAVILSLYFLTPKSTVNRFRQIFKDVREKENAEAMLSGPWPPYNFVSIDPGKTGDMTPFR